MASAELLINFLFIRYSLFPLRSNTLYLSAKETSPGKSSFLQPMPGTSTDIRLLAAGFAMMCLLTLLYLPRMYFLFVGTGFCSLASFSAYLAVNHLATY